MSRQHDTSEVGGAPDRSKGRNSSPGSMENVYEIPSTGAPSSFLGLAERLAGCRAASVTVNGVKIEREGAPSSDDLPSELGPVQKKAKVEPADVVEQQSVFSSPDLVGEARSTVLLCLQSRVLGFRSCLPWDLHPLFGRV